MPAAALWLMDHPLDHPPGRIPHPLLTRPPAPPDGPGAKRSPRRLRL